MITRNLGRLTPSRERLRARGIHVISRWYNEQIYQLFHVPYIIIIYYVLHTLSDHIVTLNAQLFQIIYFIYAIYIFIIYISYYTFSLFYIILMQCSDPFNVCLPHTYRNPHTCLAHLYLDDHIFIVFSSYADQIQCHPHRGRVQSNPE